jgi:hypothetical protein
MKVIKLFVLIMVWLISLIFFASFVKSAFPESPMIYFTVGIVACVVWTSPVYFWCLSSENQSAHYAAKAKKGLIVLITIFVALIGWLLFLIGWLFGLIFILILAGHVANEDPSTAGFLGVFALCVYTPIYFEYFLGDSEERGDHSAEFKGKTLENRRAKEWR